MDDPSAQDDLVAPDDSRGSGPPPSAQGYGDQNKGRGERPHQIFTGEAKSWLPLEDREGAEQGADRGEIYSPGIWPGRPMRGCQPTGDRSHRSVRRPMTGFLSADI